MSETKRVLDYLIKPPLEAAAARHKRPAIAAADAQRVMLAIGTIESGLKETVQLGAGRVRLENLARGLWQFESGGGVRGVLTHVAAAWCRNEIVEMGYPLHTDTLHWALAYDQRLAAIMARALLWTDAQPMPRDEKGAWELYLRTWRPGKPRPDHWAAAWRVASEAVNGSADRVEPVAPPIEPTGNTGEFVFTRRRGAVKLYWTGGVAWPPGSAHYPSWHHRPEKAERFKSRAEAAAMVELWPALQGTQGHAITIEEVAP